MRRFVAGAAAASVAAFACAAGTGGYDGSADGGSSVDADVAALEAGGSDAGFVTGRDGSVSDDAGGEPADAGPIDAASAPDAGTLDAEEVSEASADAGGPTIAAGSCDPADWIVTASASAPNNPPSFAVDGLAPTRWSTGTGQTVGQYFQIDFGGLVALDQIALDDSYGTNEAEDYARAVEVLGSADGVTFATTIATADFSTDPGAIATISFASATTRAIRLQVTTGVASLWWAIHELRLDCRLATADGGVGSPFDGGGSAAASCAASDGGWTAGAGASHASWTASASSVGPSDTAQGAIDGTSTTRWSSGQAQAGGEWFKVDLGEATSISGVALYLLNGNVGDYPSAYALQLSADDLTYSTVATGLGAATTPICLPSPASARYVKVTQTGTGDASWWSVYEMNVFP